MVFLPAHGKVIAASKVWFWSPRPHQRLKVIASAARSQPIIINVNGTNFVNRLVTSGKHFDGKDFNVRIVPVVFQDAGVYTCFLERNLFPAIDLITVKVTAEPSDAVTEGDNVTLTCSVSHVTGSMRLVWINGDGKRVGEKTLTEEEKSPSLVIQKAERGRGNWRCGLFHQDLPRLFVPYQELRGSLDISSFTDIRIIIVLGYLVIKLAVALGLICCLWRMNRSCRNPREVTGNVTNNSNEAVALQTLNSDPDLRDQNE
ncbi:CD276 antigen homolog [Amblyraja radiata]|uniref:CD276 antigen homolog n=1 Tax=Amblyraja radiata TaxID=386614 RepID=UPI001401D2E9|nr:CD276 antigen homolog [Amblyraja radiata]